MYGLAVARRRACLAQTQLQLPPRAIPQASTQSLARHRTYFKMNIQSIMSRSANSLVHHLNYIKYSQEKKFISFFLSFLNTIFRNLVKVAI